MFLHPVTTSPASAYLVMRLRVVLPLVLLATAARAEDPQLETLVRQALEARPEIQQAAAETRAAEHRIPQVEGWADPMLEVGVQNDSFTKWNVGEMEMSWVSFMATQTFPFPGKTTARGDVARADVTLSKLSADRVRLTTIGEVRRAYLALQLAREKRALLEKLIGLNERLVAAAKLRAETGAGTQAELLRAQVELSRAQQRRFALDAEEHLQEELINQYRQHDSHERVASAPLSKELPTLLTVEQFVELAHQRSPEYLAAKAGLARAEAVASLARRSQFPDFSVSAGVMVRGRLDPMWTVTLGVPLPAFTIAREVRRGAEASALREASERSAHTIEDLLALRARHRRETFTALAATWKSYQEGLLAQIDSAAESALGQYAAGRGTLASVLEVNTLALAETEASLQVLVDAQRLAIEQDELSPNEGTSASLPAGARNAGSASSSSGM